MASGEAKEISVGQMALFGAQVCWLAVSKAVEYPSQRISAQSICRDVCRNFEQNAQAWKTPTYISNDMQTIYDSVSSMAERFIESMRRNNLDMEKGLYEIARDLYIGLCLGKLFGCNCEDTVWAKLRYKEAKVHAMLRVLTPSDLRRIVHMVERG